MRTITDKVADICQPYCKCRNTYVTRALLSIELNEMMQEEEVKGIIYSYEVICDDTNNTPIVLADGRLMADITYFIKCGGQSTEIHIDIKLNDDPMAAFDRAMKGI